MPSFLSGMPIGPDDRMRGIAPSLLKEEAHWDIWTGMIASFIGGNLSFAMVFQAAAGNWAIACLLAIPASIAWWRGLTRIRSACRILGHLESMSGPI